ncbi:Expansin-like A2, partial [Cucurbita argyrosperma subsp. sororia]
MGWFFTVLLLFIASFANACDRCIFQSKAAHYYEDAPTSYGGACGYGNLGLEMSQGYFAAAVPSLFREGMGCGACYQMGEHVVMATWPCSSLMASLQLLCLPFTDKELAVALAIR